MFQEFTWFNCDYILTFIYIISHSKMFYKASFCYSFRSCICLSVDRRLLKNYWNLTNRSATCGKLRVLCTYLMNYLFVSVAGFSEQLWRENPKIGMHYHRPSSIVLRKFYRTVTLRTARSQTHMFTHFPHILVFESHKCGRLSLMRQHKTFCVMLC